jgi:putative addiction module component (TIGR02574 family)
MSAVDQILSEALKLPESDRAAIADRLLRSLDHDRQEKDPGYDEAWAAEIERRSNDLAEGRAVLIEEGDLWVRIDEKIAEIRASKAMAGGRES